MSEVSTSPAPRVPAGPLRPWLMPLARGLEIVAMALVVVATGAIMTEVVARGVFSIGLPGVGEVAKWAGLGLIFLGVPLLLARDEHVKVDMLFALSRGGTRRGLAFGNELATVLFCALFLWACWGFMQRAARFSTPALGIPNALYYLPAIVGMVLAALVAADRLAGLLMGRSAERDADRGEPGAC